MSKKEKETKKKVKKEKEVKDADTLYYEAAAKTLTKERRTKIFLIVGLCLIVAVSGFAALIDSEDGAGAETAAVAYVSNREKNIVKSDGAVSVVVPEIYIPEDFTNELTAEQIDFGFNAIKLNENGSVTYRINSGDYKRYVANLEQKTKAEIEAMPSTGNYPSVKSMECNDDFTEVKVTVDKEAYEGSWDNLALYDSFELIGYLQAMQGYANAGIEAEYMIIDSASGEQYTTVSFPEALNQNF